MLNRQDIERELDGNGLSEKQLIRIVESVQRLLVTHSWLIMEVVGQHPEKTDEELRKIILGRLKDLL